MGFKSINKAGEIGEIARQVTIALGFFNALSQDDHITTVTSVTYGA